MGRDCEVDKKTHHGSQRRACGTKSNAAVAFSESDPPDRSHQRESTRERHSLTHHPFRDLPIRRVSLSLLLLFLHPVSPEASCLSPLVKTHHH